MNVGADWAEVAVVATTVGNTTTGAMRGGIGGACGRSGTGSFGGRGAGTLGGVTILTSKGLATRARPAGFSPRRNATANSACNSMAINSVGTRRRQGTVRVVIVVLSAWPPGPQYSGGNGAANTRQIQGWQRQPSHCGRGQRRGQPRRAGDCVGRSACSARASTVAGAALASSVTISVSSGAGGSSVAN